jgi:copper chaperone CopZ
MDIHCEGCAKKIRHAVKHLEGDFYLFIATNI